MKKRIVLKTIIGIFIALVTIGSLLFGPLNKTDAYNYKHQIFYINDKSWDGYNTGDLVQRTSDGSINMYYVYANYPVELIENGTAIRARDKYHDLGSKTEEGIQFIYRFSGPRGENIARNFTIDLNVSARFYRQAAAYHEAGFKVHYIVGQETYTEIYYEHITEQDQYVSHTFKVPQGYSEYKIEFFNHGNLTARGYVKDPHISFTNNNTLKLNPEVKFSFSDKPTISPEDEVNDVHIGSKIYLYVTANMDFHYADANITIGERNINVYTTSRSKKYMAIPIEIPKIYIGEKNFEKIVINKVSIEANEWTASLEDKDLKYNRNVLFYPEGDKVQLKIAGPDNAENIYYLNFGEDVKIELPTYVGYKPVETTDIVIDEKYKDIPYEVVTENGINYLVIKKLKNAVSFTATAKKKTYTLTLIDVNEVVGEYTYEHGALIEDTFPVLHKNHYIFRGYCTETNAHIITSDGKFVPYITHYNFGEDIVLYSDYDGENYGIYMVYESGYTRWVGQGNRETGLPEKIWFPYPLSDGYSFEGFFDQPEGKGTMYYSHPWGFDNRVKEFYDGEGDLYLYPYVIPNKYTYSLDPQNGEAPKKITVEYGSKLPDLEAIPILPGYDFLGYYDMKDSLHPVQFYDQDGIGREIYIPEDRDLVARYKPGELKVTVKYPNGFMEDDVFTAVTEQYLIIKVRYFEGYDYIGYFTEPDGKGTMVLDDYGISIEPYNFGKDITVYCHLQKSRYDYIFYPENDGEITKTNYVYGDPINNAEIPTKPGYKFAGWYEFLNKEELLHFDALGNKQYDNYKRESDIELYARWEPDTYNVTIKQGNGSDDINFDIVMDTAYPELTKPERFGYSFGGVYTEENGKGVEIYNAEGVASNNFNLAKDSTLYVYWIANDIEVTLNTFDGTETIIAGYEQELPKIDIPTKPGFNFVGYYEKPYGEGEQYYDALGNGVKALTSLEPITIHAHFEHKTIKISLYGEDFIEVKYTARLPQEVNVPTRVGYQFKGYYTEDNGLGELIYDELGKRNGEQICTFTEDVSLYAKWEANTYSFTYNSNKPLTASSEISGETLNSTHSYGTPSKLTKNGFSLTGYHFVGWALEADGEATLDDEAEVLNLAESGEITLYAKWEINTYIVRFNSGHNPTNGVSLFEGTMPDLVVKYDEKIVLPENGYSLRGARFINWTNSLENPQDFFEVGTELINLTTEDNIILNFYCNWEANTYSLSYNSNKPLTASSEISGETLNSTHIYGTPSKLTKNGFSLTGYNFVGWALEADGEATLLDEAELTNLVESGEITLYAVWEAINYIVKFNSGNNPTNGVSIFEGAMPDLVVKYDEKIVLPENGYSLRGARFINWTNSLENPKDYFEVGTELINLTTKDNIILNFYCNWEALDVELVFDTMGGTPVESYTASFGVLLNEMISSNMNDALCNKLPKRYGFEFAGFFEDLEFKKEIINVNGLSSTYKRFVDWEGTKTIYAKWNAYKFKLFLESPKTSYRKDFDVTFENLVLPVLEDYSNFKFIGWSTDPNPTAPMYEAGVKIDEIPYDESYNKLIPGQTTERYHGSIKLYAVWKSMNYKIIYFNANQALQFFDYKAGEQVIIKEASDLKFLEIPEGMYLAGWSPIKGAKDPVYLPGQILEEDITLEDKINLYAVFKELPANPTTKTMWLEKRKY